MEECGDRVLEVQMLEQHLRNAPKGVMCIPMMTVDMAPVASTKRRFHKLLVRLCLRFS
jgi:hypothetical protein